MERRREVERVENDAMRLVRPGRELDHVRKAHEHTQRLELGVADRAEVGRRIRHDARIRGLPEDARDPRVRILHVEYRIVRALFLRELEVELELAVRLAEQEEEARGVRPDLVEDVAERNELAGALPHPDRLAAAREIHELDEQDAKAGGIA